MGSLYLGWDPMLERQVAIKLLREGFDNEELRVRFTRESRSAARLRHPNIVTVFDVGEHEGRPFIAMEYIQGHTLADFIRAGITLSILRKLQLMEDLCAGLAYAHKAGIVHRDIKPANIMVDGEGVLKILDFGIARVGESGITQSGIMMGTLNYMSPEQMTGQHVDGRSDIFAVGAVFYELLAYRQAFPGGVENGIFNKILNLPPDPIEQHCAGLDAEIVGIVGRALAKEPGARYQELASMRKDILRVRQRLEAAEPEPDSTATIDEAPTVIGEAAPTPLPRTPRRGTDRTELARRRATQIERHLDGARKAMAREDFELVITECEHALLLDPEEPRAIELLDRARGVLEPRQVEEWLEHARERLLQQDVDAAEQLVRQALDLDPAAEAAKDIQRRIDEARRERERLGQRADAVRGAVQRGTASFEQGAFDQAAAAAAEALAIDPAAAEALALQQRAAEAIARQRREALDRRARAAVDAAERLVAKGRHEAAAAQLERFEPFHPLVSQAATRLRAEAERIERERDEARRARETCEAAQRLFSGGKHREAVALLERFKPPHPVVIELLGTLRAEVERIEREHADERRAREAVDAARKLFQTGEHEAALTRLDQYSPPRPLVTKAREELWAEVERIRRERLEERRAREAGEQARRLFAEGRRDAAIELLAGFQPRHVLVTKILAELRAEADRIRREEEEGARAGACIEEARRLFAQGKYDDAFHTLEAFTPSRPLVNQALGELRGEHKIIQRRREDEEQRRRAETAKQDRQQRIASELQAAHDAMGRQDFAAALDILNTLKQAEPGLADIKPLLKEAEARKLAGDWARRVSREVARRLTKAEELVQKQDFAGAMVQIKAALNLDADHDGVRALKARIDHAIRAGEGRQV